MDHNLADELMLNESACWSEGIGGDTGVVVEKIYAHFPDLKDKYSWISP